MFQTNEHSRKTHYELSDEHSVRHHHSLTIARPVTDYNNTLSESEGLKLMELLYTMKETHQYSCLDVVKEPAIENACMAWALKCQSDTQKIIKMFKNLKAFAALSENDQLALVKYGSVEAYIMRLVLHYDFEKRYFRLEYVRPHLDER